MRRARRSGAFGDVAHSVISAARRRSDLQLKIASFLYLPEGRSETSRLENLITFNYIFPQFGLGKPRDHKRNGGGAQWRRRGTLERRQDRGAPRRRSTPARAPPDNCRRSACICWTGRRVNYNIANFALAMMMMIMHSDADRTVIDFKCSAPTPHCAPPPL